MGAAASMKLIYADALGWFKQYFDENTYVDDFHALDKNGDGGISFDELRVWLQEKAKNNPSWKAVVANQSVFRAAHMFAAEKIDDKGVISVSTQAGEALVDSSEPERIFGLEQFKNFLMHLFVLSVLYVHFKHADEWSGGQDVGNDRLTLTEFKLASRTFMSAQANEETTEEKVTADFKMLDLDGDGTVDFLEVCTYCSRFAHPEFATQFLTSGTPATAHMSLVVVQPEDIDADDTSGTVGDASSRKQQRQLLAGGSSSSRQLQANCGAGRDGAMCVIGHEIDKNESIAQFQEIKVSTEIMLGLF